MSHQYRMVQWNPFKRRFDAWMVAGMLGFLAAFAIGSSLGWPQGERFTPVQVLLRATGTLALAMLGFLLCIGPLSRLSPRFKPFLYNRRHLGVTTFLVALTHAVLVVVWYHGSGVVDPLVSLLASNAADGSLLGIPFEWFGVAALGILFVLAATSHDFWNANLGPGLWKAIHLLVVPAYGLLLAHVALGALQSERDGPALWLLGAAAAVVIGLQCWGLWTASGPDTRVSPSGTWLRVGPVADIPEGRALVVEPAGDERIAVFRFDGQVAAVSNVCRHQGGPLGEGRIVDGCITCPWHGYQYRPTDGCSPAPYTERIATYETRIQAGIVFVHRTPRPPGTPVTPSPIDQEVA